MSGAIQSEFYAIRAIVPGTGKGKWPKGSNGGYFYYNFQHKVFEMRKSDDGEGTLEGYAFPGIFTDAAAARALAQIEFPKKYKKLLIEVHKINYIMNIDDGKLFTQGFTVVASRLPS